MPARFTLDSCIPLLLVGSGARYAKQLISSAKKKTTGSEWGVRTAFFVSFSFIPGKMAGPDWILEKKGN